MASPTGGGLLSKDDWLECRMILVLDDPGPTLVEEDLRGTDDALETGVLGGEFTVGAWEPKDAFAC